MTTGQPPSRLSPAQSAAVEALFEPGATVASIAQRLKLTLEGLLDLLDTPEVRRLLHRLVELESIRHQLNAAVPISAALRALTKLLDRADAGPTELRRAATSILRSCSESRADRRSAAPSGVDRRSATDGWVPRHSVAESEFDHSATDSDADQNPADPVSRDNACDSVLSPQSPSTRGNSVLSPQPSSTSSLISRHLGTLTPLQGKPSPTLRLAQAAGGPAP